MSEQETASRQRKPQNMMPEIVLHSYFRCQRKKILVSFSKEDWTLWVKNCSRVLYALLNCSNIIVYIETGIAYKVFSRNLIHDILGLSRIKEKIDLSMSINKLYFKIFIFISKLIISLIKSNSHVFTSYCISSLLFLQYKYVKVSCF